MKGLRSSRSPVKTMWQGVPVTGTADLAIRPGITSAVAAIDRAVASVANA